MPMATITRRQRSLNLAAPEYRRNPYPLYRQLRHEDPVALVKVPFFGSVHFVSRYDDVAAALKDPRLSTDMRHYAIVQMAGIERVPRSIKVLQMNMLTTDDPQHGRLRRLVHLAFTPKRVANMADRIATISHELLDRADRRGGPVDLVADYAMPIPLVIISEMLAVPEEDRMAFHHMAAKFLEGTSSGIMQLMTQYGNMRAIMRFFTRLIAARRADLGDDLLSAMIEAEIDGDRLTDDELIGMMFLLYLAGHETTVHLIAGGALGLLEWPDAFAQLQADRGLMDTALEELIRYTDPVELSTPRYAMETLEIGAVTVEKGSRILVGIGSANRDETVFEEPDRVIVTRSPNRHLAFGLGTHYCLGAPLARLEGRIALEALLDRWPDMRLAAPIEQLKWRSSTVVRGLKALPVTVR
jgi:cytochrome P450